jgi:hypothetical protein
MVLWRYKRHILQVTLSRVNHGLLQHLSAYLKKSKSSTSKIKVALGGIVPIPLSP